jgi:hypothetical protein
VTAPASSLVQVKTCLEGYVDLFHLFGSGGAELFTEPGTNHALYGRDDRLAVVTDALSENAFWIAVDEVDA